jgi:hypothetical protein
MLEADGFFENVSKVAIKLLEILIDKIDNLLERVLFHAQQNMGRFTQTIWGRKF